MSANDGAGIVAAFSFGVSVMGVRWVLADRGMVPAAYAWVFGILAWLSMVTAIACAFGSHERACYAQVHNGNAWVCVAYESTEDRPEAPACKHRRNNGERWICLDAVTP